MLVEGRQAGRKWLFPSIAHPIKPSLWEFPERTDCWQCTEEEAEEDPSKSQEVLGEQSIVRQSLRTTTEYLHTLESQNGMGIKGKQDHAATPFILF